MKFKRECGNNKIKGCGKKFRPYSKFSVLCDDCYDNSKGVRKMSSGRKVNEISS